jgi:hypothetical protein
MANSDNAAGRQLILRALEPTAKALKVELLPSRAEISFRLFRNVHHHRF